MKTVKSIPKKFFLPLCLMILTAVAMPRISAAQGRDGGHDEFHHDSQETRRPSRAKRRARENRKAKAASRRHWWNRVERKREKSGPEKNQPNDLRRPHFLTAPRAVVRPNFKPRRSFPRPSVIRDAGRLVRDGRFIPPPRRDWTGAKIAGQPLHQPPSPRIIAFNNPVFRQRVATQRTSEMRRGRYYWHNDGGVRYCLYRDAAGVRWYGFYSGSTYYWTRLQYGRWWWYDPLWQRWVYYGNGYWWWQNPASPQTIYVYSDGVYEPYGGPVIDEPIMTIAASSAPAAASRYHSDVDVPDYQAPANPDSYALVVGVENYSSLPAASFADRDAQAMDDHLLHLGYPARNIILLRDSQAGLSAMSKYLESWLPKNVDKNSRVFFYFAGHGAPDPQNGEAYLMPWDGDAKYLAQTGYPLKKLYQDLNALPAQQIYVVLDSCFSGEGGRSVIASGTRPLVTRVDSALGAMGRLVVFTAAGQNEITGTAPGQGHGLFTYYFLKGLNGAAAGNADGITVQQLYDYLAPNVEDQARRDNREQSPQLFVPPNGQRQFLIEDLKG